MMRLARSRNRIRPQAFLKAQKLLLVAELHINNFELLSVVSVELGMPVLGWAFFAVLIAIAISGYGQIAAVFVLFLLAVPASALFLPILRSLSSAEAARKIWV